MGGYKNCVNAASSLWKLRLATYAQENRSHGDWHDYKRKPALKWIWRWSRQPIMWLFYGPAIHLELNKVKILFTASCVYCITITRTYLYLYCPRPMTSFELTIANHTPTVEDTDTSIRKSYSSCLVTPASTHSREKSANVSQIRYAWNTLVSLTSASGNCSYTQSPYMIS